MKKGKKRAACILTCAVVAAGAFFETLPARAVFDESQAVHYSEFAASNSIEDSTLFIGTYLIHTQSMTDELYEKALDSASESGQNAVYYKSELADGTWFDISHASGLAEISTEGVIVEESELADLWVTSWTDSSGVTRDARSGAAVSIFDTPDPYELYTMKELEPIRLQYDNALFPDNGGADRYYHDILRDFFGKDLRNDVTAECDRQLAGLQSCYEQLTSMGETDMAQVVSTLMSRIDSRRRAEVLYQLSQIDDSELNTLQTLCTGSQYNEEDYDDKQFVENSGVMDAVGTAIENCQESYIEHSGNMLEDGSTVLKNVEYEKSMNVIDQAGGGWNESLRALLAELQALYHIQDDVIADADAELALLDGTLLPRVQDKFVGAVSAGADGQYQAAVAAGRSDAVCQQLLEDQKTQTNGVRSELQYLVKAKKDRESAQDALDYVYAQIDAAEGYKDRIPADAFAEKAEETVDAYILWLSDLTAAIVSEDVETGSEMDQLEARKDELQGLRADALADNDLAGARRYDAMIDLVDQQIAEEQAKLSAVLNDPGSSAAQKAKAANAAGGSTVLKNINQLKNSVLSAIADGQTSGTGLAGIGNNLEALTALGAEAALKEIRDSLGEDAAASGLADQVDSAVADSRNSSLYGALEGNIGASEFENRIEELLGSPFAGLSGPEKAAVAAAADRLGEAGSPELAEAALDYLNQCLEEGNPYVYRKLKGETEEYLPLKLIAAGNGYRYVYSDSRREAVLSRRGALYCFTVSTAQVELRDGAVQQLTQTVRMQELPYIIEQDAETYFHCEAEYIENSDYGVCLNQSMQGMVEDIISAAAEGEE